MEKIEFKSQICTDINQSRKLLELGLKKETADMRLRWLYCHRDEDYYQPIPNDFATSYDDIPAWSLHRLMEIMYNGDMFGFVGLTTHNRNIDTIYELVIANIEGLSRIDKFNQDYLEEKK